MDDRSSRPASTTAVGEGNTNETPAQHGGESGTHENLSEDAGDPSHRNSDDEPGRELMVIDNNGKTEGWLTRLMIRLGLRSGTTLRDDLTEALAGDSEDSNVFSPEERAMLQNILRLRELRVEDVMVPRSEIHAVDLEDDLTTVLKEFETTGHSRLPVYVDTMDDPRGMVLIKDLLLHMTRIAAQTPAKKSDEGKSKSPAKANGANRKLRLSKVDLSAKLADIDVMRKVLFVPPSMMASELMGRMQATRTQMALVIDEYGGTDGLVSLEDIVEEVVGEIEDEHDDDDEHMISSTGEGMWNVDARIELDDLAKEIGGTFDPGDRGEDFDTLGGLVFALAGHVPVRGEVVRGIPGYEFRVLDADPRRIRRMQVVQLSMREKRRKAAASKAAAE